MKKKPTPKLRAGSGKIPRRAIALDIQLLQSKADARFCADFITTSEPWVTLGLTFEQALERLTNPTRETYIAKVDRQIVGVLILFLEGTFKGYIQTIAVHPDWRAQGIGVRLMAFAEDRIFRVSPNVFLCVSSFNERAQKLYERLGYKLVGELIDFVVVGYSEFLMRKTRGALRDFKPR